MAVPTKDGLAGNLELAPRSSAGDPEIWTAGAEVCRWVSVPGIIVVVQAAKGTLRPAGAAVMAAALAAFLPRLLSRLCTRKARDQVKEMCRTT